MNNTKDISYLGKDFNRFKQNLVDFVKQYFPNDYTDFNESSPGMIFLEMASYVGDVLSYYTDSNLKESLLTLTTSPAFGIVDSTVCEHLLCNCSIKAIGTI